MVPDSSPTSQFDNPINSVTQLYTLNQPYKLYTMDYNAENSTSSDIRSQIIASPLIFATAHAGGFRHDQMRGFIERCVVENEPEHNSDSITESESVDTTSKKHSLNPLSFLRRVRLRWLQREEHMSMDGDLWVEARVVLDGVVGTELIRGKKVRSYFISKNTGKIVWDHPPADAAKVIHLKNSRRVHFLEKPLKNSIRSRQ